MEITTGRCQDWGRDVPVIDRNTAVFTFVVAGAVSIGLAASSERSAEAAHLLWEQVVAGSSPAAPTMIFTGP